MKKAVLLVTFNRKDCLEKSFAAVAAAKPPRLYLASDGPRSNKTGESDVINDIREWMLAHVTWPCEVKTRFLETNSGGCGPGVSGAITWFFQNEKDGIIVEDDCVPSQTFFELCEECLDQYSADKRIWQVCGNTPIFAKVKTSYFFTCLPLCWGWATWADRWAKFDITRWKCDMRTLDSISSCSQVRDFFIRIMEHGASGQIETWDYQWVFTVFSECGLCIVPKENLVSNCGLVGVHYSISPNDALANRLNTPVSNFTRILHPGKIKLNRKYNERILKNICHVDPIHKRIKRTMRVFVSKAMNLILPQSVIGLIREIRK